MNNFSKVIITVVGVLVLLFIFFFLFAAVVGVRSDAGQKTPGIFGLILFGALFGALRAIWKKSSKDEDKSDHDSSVLQK